MKYFEKEKLGDTIAKCEWSLLSVLLLVILLIDMNTLDEVHTTKTK